MNRFAYTRAATIDQAVQALGANANARPVAGGTNLVDLMKYDVERPTELVDITRLPLAAIEELPDGGLRLGALVTNADAARDPRVMARYPLLQSAMLAGASPQLRNAATTGGNLLQRTRCYYFYDAATPCNKRAPGSGCPAIGGVNRIHAILGASDQCIATHPSDMAVALAALDAVVQVRGPAGARAIAIGELHRLPGAHPERDTTLEPGELILGVDLPPSDFGAHHTYLKLRDRLSYAFALVSVAAAVRLEAGAISEARLALGGVAHKPWRDREAEQSLVGQPATAQTFGGFADRVLETARGYSHNRFKIDLARRAMIRALSQASAATPQSQIDKSIA